MALSEGVFLPCKVPEAKDIWDFRFMLIHCKINHAEAGISI